MQFPFKAVLFDWAYTLVNLVTEDNRKAFYFLSKFIKENDIYDGDFEALYDPFHELFNDLIELSRKTHREACFEDVLKYFLLRCGVKLNDDKRIRNLLEVYYEVIYKPREVYPDTVSTLKTLRKSGVRLGVISNTTNPGFMKDLERKSMDLDQFFEFSIYSSEVPYRKPHPSIFKLAIDRLNLRPDEILFVGDSLDTDVAGAQGVGIQTVWLTRNKLKNHGKIRPDYEIISLAQLIDETQGFWRNK